MAGVGFIALAALVLLLLPVVVLPWEGRRVPDTLYAAIAGGGLATAGLKGGAAAVPWAAALGLISLLAVAAIVTVIRAFLNLQVLTSGHIKLLAAGSIWLGGVGALVMVCVAFAALFGTAIILNRGSEARRPDFAAIAALAILCIGIKQALPERGGASFTRQAQLSGQSHEQ